MGFSKTRPNGGQIREEFNELFDEVLASGQLKQSYDKNGMSPDYEKPGSKGAVSNREMNVVSTSPVTGSAIKKYSTGVHGEKNARKGDFRNCRGAGDGLLVGGAIVVAP